MYYPPTQLFNVDKHNMRDVVFEYMLMQLTEPEAEKSGDDAEDAFLIGFAKVLIPMTAKAGIKKHGKAAEEDALMAEFAQLVEDLLVYESIDPTILTEKQKQAALRALILIKEKCDGRLKGRTVADGRPQCPQRFQLMLLCYPLWWMCTKAETWHPPMWWGISQGLYGRVCHHEIYGRVRQYIVQNEREVQSFCGNRGKGKGLII
jgi:hypothetical protein